MATIVEHDKRRQEILQRALDVFIDEGYEDVTFQKIADRCGITRTTLYIYFKNKREIFLWSIKQLTETLEVQLLEVVKDTSLSSEAALKKIFRIIIDVCQENPKLFTVLLSYLIQLQKSGGDPEERVRRRVIKIRHIICIVLIRGMKSGEVKKVNLKATTEMLYSVFESAIFKIAVLNKTEISDMIDVADVAIENLMA
ncbi:MAG: TetR/AcrR family transcriptional regulator [Treponema sp.]|nr:TetR/AcrR family transcriptional regulator [Treponema sp.]